MKKLNWIYPGLVKWAEENGQTAESLSRQIGVTSTTLRRWLSGVHEVPLWGIRAILQATGLTFEEAFQEKEKPLQNGNSKSGKDK